MVGVACTLEFQNLHCSVASTTREKRTIASTYSLGLRYSDDPPAPGPDEELCYPAAKPFFTIGTDLDAVDR